MEIQVSRHDFGKYLFCVRVPLIWNNLSNSNINALNVNQLKVKLGDSWSKCDGYIIIIRRSYGDGSGNMYKLQWLYNYIELYIVNVDVKPKAYIINFSVLKF